MKTRIFLSVVLLAITGGQAMAACSGTQVVNAGVTETATVTFSGANGGNSTAGGLTATWTGNRTAATVAAKFASLANGTKSGDGAGFTMTGSLSGWNTGAAAGALVVFTSATVNTNVTDIAVSGSPSPSAVTTQGSPANNALTTLLSGKTVCVGSAGNWQNQEYHASTGALIDWKHGADVHDPTTQIGTWAIVGNQVQYSYYDGGSYTFDVYDNGNGTYSFCTGGSSAAEATIRTGQVGC